MTQQNIPQLTDEEIMQAYISDSNNKELHIKIAHVLGEQFKNKWFSVLDINRKTAIKSSKEATRMTYGLVLFQLAASREERGKTQFRITITPEQKIKVLEERKETHMKQISLIDIEIEKLQTKEVSK